MHAHPDPLVQVFGLTDYASMWEKMRCANLHHTPTTAEAIWLTEHYPVYTLGLAGRAEHLHDAAKSIPMIHTDRGGQVTYHGPGQVMVYTLIHLAARKLGVRDYVSRLEQAVINVLQPLGIAAHRWAGKPGVYVHEAKISALGLRVKRGACYHGLAFNVNMNLSPFQHIDPCGYANLAVTDLAHELPTHHPQRSTLMQPNFYGHKIAAEIIQLLRG